MQYFDTMKVPRVLMPHHQIEPLHVGPLRVGQADGAGIVDADVDAAEFGDRLVDRRHYLGLFADVAQDRQRLAAGAADFVGGGVDSALEFRVRLGGLGGNRDIGAVPRGAQRNREPDSAAAAGYEQCLAFEVCHRVSSGRISGIRMQNPAAGFRQGEGRDEEHPVGRDGKNRNRVAERRRG
jgi:hypothetical protein